MANPLIRTKLHLPFSRAGIVSRPRLRERLAQGLCCPLTIITAPAGFGKTTLLAAYITGFGMPVAWLSLDKNDNQTWRFLSYLIAALQEVNTATGIEASQLMAPTQQTPLEVVLTSLVNDLEAGGELVLVMDDYQFITSHEVQEAVAFLVEHCPKSFHLVIASRSDPALPLARLRGRSQTVEIRAADLRFNQPEAGQFLTDVMRFSLDSDSVTALTERTEGWAAGLQMAAVSMRDREDLRGFIQDFSGTNRYIMDYLLEEVLDSQEPGIQLFLLNTAILERLNAPLCEAIVPKQEWSATEGSVSQRAPFDSQSILEYLEEANLFLIPLDDKRLWYRYHHLFADLLRAKLQQDQPDLIPHLHVRASDWLERNGYLTEAIHHLFAADEINRAADLIERYGPARLAEGDPSVFHLSERLPEEIILARPKVSLHQTWMLIIQAHIAKARAMLLALRRRLLEMEHTVENQWMLTFIQSSLAFLSPPPGAPGYEPLPDYHLLDEIPADEPILRNAADILYGMALARRGEMDRAVEVSVKCIQREKTQQGILTIPTLAPFLSRIYLMQGRLHAAASLCHEFLDPLKEKDIRFIFTAGSMDIDLGEILFERNCLDEAEQYIREGLQANTIWRNIMTDGFGLSALIRLLQAKGEYAAAMRLVDEFEKRMSEDAHPREFDENIRTMRIRIQLASGDVNNPSRWADQVLLSEDFRNNERYYRLTLARIRLAQGRYADVEKILAGTVPPPAINSHISRVLETYLLSAVAISGQGRLTEAFGLIETCLSLAEPEGYVSIFLEVGEPIRELLAAYLRSASPEHKHYARLILDAFEQTRPPGIPPEQQTGLIEPLTGRELEVLQLLALGKTNQEIARQLIVAPGTIKAHTASIYRKLDAANRTEAVAHARQLGFLS